MRVAVRGARASLLAVSLFAEEGWSVRVDRRAAPLTRVDGALLGVVVPAGPHDVGFSYDPDHADLAVAVTLVGAGPRGLALVSPAWPARW